MNASIESGHRSRGRPVIPEAWTRVISVKYDEEISFKTYSIASELLLEDAMPQMSRSLRSKSDWRMLFNPAEFWNENPDMTIEN